MANSSLVCPAFPLHHDSCDRLVISLEKAKALTDVATLLPFSDCPAATIHNYIYALGDAVENARIAADELCKRPEGDTSPNTNISPKMDS